MNQPVTVFYQAAFANLVSSGVTASAADLAYDLKSYFEPGTRLIEYGTTPSLGSSTAGVACAEHGRVVRRDLVTQWIERVDHLLLASALRDLNSGTFTSATQSFTTGGASTQLLTVNTR